jgi:DNA-binding NarL/FixJ family response regulator
VSPLGWRGRGFDLIDHRQERVRVGIVDDHPAILASLVSAIEASGDLEVVGTARSARDAVVLAAGVDVLCCDLNLDGRTEGLDVLEAIHDPRSIAADPPAVLILTAYGQASLIRSALERGAAGYLDKSADVAEIVDAIRTVARGGTVYSAAALMRSRGAPRRPSDREVQVIELVVGGATNAEIASALGLSERTVESHLRRLFDRYGSMSRTELAVRSIDEGWVVRPSDP